MSAEHVLVDVAAPAGPAGDDEGAVPGGPGWGCDVDEDVLRAHPVP